MFYKILLKIFEAGMTGYSRQRLLCHPQEFEKLSTFTFIVLTF